MTTALIILGAFAAGILTALTYLAIKAVGLIEETWWR